MTSIDYQSAIEDTRRTIENIIRTLVNHPGDVRVEVAINEWDVLLRVYVRPEDRGQVIGKQGRLAQSLRVVLMGFGNAQGVSYTLDIK